ncbi:MFS transporter [Synechococcus sp. PCC 7336]|uniref:MFS transporter n=1 Tax=Synechococcus sp. PCC 7336 TaxID=195250 RepID=UPI00034899EE|nr:MFS transporter [Synechococcus sp. PCC 7336]
MTQGLQLDRKIQLVLSAMFVSGMLFWGSITCLLPTLPLYLDHLGASDRQVGLVMSCFAIGLVCSRPWLGPLADRRGRKLVLFIGLVAAAIAPIGYLFIKSLGGVALVRAGHGISIAAFATAYVALVADIAPPQFRGTVIGNMSLVNPIALMLGPAIGGYVLKWGGFNSLFLVAASLGGLGLILATFVQEAPFVSGQPKPAIDDRFWSLLGQPRLMTPTSVMLSVGLSFGSLTAFMPLFVRDGELGINPGLFYLASAIVTFGMRLGVGRASDRIGRGIFITLGLCFTSLGLLILASAQSPAQVLLAGSFQGAGFGILIPMMSALMGDRSHPHERGRLFGLCLGGFDVGLACAGLLLGQAADWWGYRALFCIAAGLVASAAILFATRSAKTPAESFRFAIGQGADPHALAEPEF